MAEKPQVEGVVSPDVQVPPPAHVAPQPEVTQNATGQPAPQPQNNDVITQEPPKTHNMSTGAPNAPEKALPQVTPLHKLNGNTTLIDCPFCKRIALTTTTKEGTWVQMATGILLGLCCICLATLPCRAGWCELTHIYCTACQSKVATIDQDGVIQVAETGPRPRIVYYK